MLTLYFIFFALLMKNLTIKESVKLDGDHGRSQGSLFSLFLIYYKLTIVMR
jgi:hypothetical protein